MKIKLTKYGRLVLDGKQRNCPHNNMSCGDWCALFSVDDYQSVRVEVGLCGRLYIVPAKDFTDERDEREDVA